MEQHSLGAQARSGANFFVSKARGGDWCRSVGSSPFRLSPRDQRLFVSPRIYKRDWFGLLISGPAKTVRSAPPPSLRVSLQHLGERCYCNSRSFCGSWGIDPTVQDHPMRLFHFENRRQGRAFLAPDRTVLYEATSRVRFESGDTV
ncbi:BQ5605_C019g08938 [Microbotryum silenes-dioicae]|uniref:BQ5605_C019g08938 protein n=1 Tax=Microbotryum silenes-dioicae TaxID=796604 RepID=A0A2X0NTZ5_9BASI|nr:BQ5605_C019g08938 [Microbotryum silenes-dioicae]